MPRTGIICYRLGSFAFQVSFVPRTGIICYRLGSFSFLVSFVPRTGIIYYRLGSFSFQVSTLMVLAYLLLSKVAILTYSLSAIFPCAHFCLTTGQEHWHSSIRSPSMFKYHY